MLHGPFFTGLDGGRQGRPPSKAGFIYYDMPHRFCWQRCQQCAGTRLYRQLLSLRYVDRGSYRTLQMAE